MPQENDAATQPGAPQETMTQAEKVLAFLTAGHTLTTMIAHNLLGVASLTTRIAELRRAGHKIVTEWKNVPDGSGKMRRYASYRLVGGAA